MINNKKIFNVKNRSSIKVIYTIPDLNIRRTFEPGQSFSVTYEELERLSFQPGGQTLMNEYLYISDPKGANEKPAEDSVLPPEYYFTEEDVKELLLNTKNDPENMDKFLDALDFGVEGVKELIKKYAVELPCNDVAKREAIKEKLHFDVTAVIQNSAPEEGAAAPKQATRRVKNSAAVEDETIVTEPKRRASKKTAE